MLNLFQIAILNPNSQLYITIIKIPLKAGKRYDKSDFSIDRLFSSIIPITNIMASKIQLKNTPKNKDSFKDMLLLNRTLSNYDLSLYFFLVL